MQRAESSYIVVVAGDMNAQVGRLSTDDAQLGGSLSLDSVRTDNGDGLLKLCADHNLFLCSTNFRNKRSRLATWCPPTVGQPWTQIDHVVISSRCCGSFTKYRSYLNKSMDLTVHWCDVDSP